MIEIYKNLIEQGFNKVTINDEFIEQDDLFIMLEGKSFDIYSITNKLLATNIKFLVTQKDLGVNDERIILVPNTKVFLEGFVNYFQYEKISKLKYYGVTGTNGKTTTSMMYYDLVNLLNKKIGYLGTLGIKYPNVNLGHNEFTTPPINMMYQYFSDMVNANVNEVIMETSAQGFDSNRLSKIKLDALAWLNFQELEHGEYYKTYDEYFDAKLLGFKKYLKEGGCAIVNGDDLQITTAVKSCLTTQTLITFGFGEHNDIYIKNHVQYPKFQQFDIVVCGKVYPNVKLHMMGKFAPLNLAVCIGFAKINENIDLNAFMNEIINLRPQKSNFEFIENDKNIDIVLDTTHTVDGYEFTLSYIKDVIKPQRLIHVFGCHGYRDKDKRPIMGATSEKYSDVMILTSDYSRDEDQMSIINAIITGIKDKSKVMINKVRSEAIEKAVEFAKPGDLIFISGKAPHEYEEFVDGSNVAFKMSDFECAKNALKEKSYD